MHMEAAQRYVLNLTEKEGETLLFELSRVPVSHMGAGLSDLYETLGIWFGQ